MGRIVRVERVPYAGWTYSLEVAEDESYIANNIVVHNCQKGVNQDAKYTVLSKALYCEDGVCPVYLPGGYVSDAGIRKAAGAATATKPVTGLRAPGMGATPGAADGAKGNMQGGNEAADVQEVAKDKADNNRAGAVPEGETDPHRRAEAYLREHGQAYVEGDRPDRRAHLWLDGDELELTLLDRRGRTRGRYSADALNEAVGRALEHVGSGRLAKHPGHGDEKVHGGDGTAGGGDFERSAERLATRYFKPEKGESLRDFPAAQAMLDGDPEFWTRSIEEIVDAARQDVQAMAKKVGMGSSKWQASKQVRGYSSLVRPGWKIKADKMKVAGTSPKRWKDEPYDRASARWHQQVENDRKTMLRYGDTLVEYESKTGTVPEAEQAKLDALVKQAREAGYKVTKDERGRGGVSIRFPRPPGLEEGGSSAEDKDALAKHPGHEDQGAHGGDRSAGQIRSTLSQGTWVAELPDGRTVSFGTERRAFGRRWADVSFARVRGGKGETAEEWNPDRGSFSAYLTDLGIEWERGQEPRLLGKNAFLSGKVHPELKHQEGEHDQRTHGPGRTTESDVSVIRAQSFNREQWRKQTRDVRLENREQVQTTMDLFDRALSENSGRTWVVRDSTGRAQAFVSLDAPRHGFSELLVGVAPAHIGEEGVHGYGYEAVKAGVEQAKKLGLKGLYADPSKRSESTLLRAGFYWPKDEETSPYMIYGSGKDWEAVLEDDMYKQAPLSAPGIGGGHRQDRGGRRSSSQVVSDPDYTELHEGHDDQSVHGKGPLVTVSNPAEKKRADSAVRGAMTYGAKAEDLAVEFTPNELAAAVALTRSDVEGFPRRDEALEAGLKILETALRYRTEGKLEVDKATSVSPDLLGQGRVTDPGSLTAQAAPRGAPGGATGGDTPAEGADTTCPHGCLVGYLTQEEAGRFGVRKSAWPWGGARVEELSTEPYGRQLPPEEGEPMAAPHTREDEEYYLNKALDTATVVICVALNPDGNPAAGVRQDRKHGETYEFPGGHVRAGEKLAAAAERELLEETGIRGRAVRRLGQKRSPNDGVPVVFVQCEVTGGEARDSRELEDVHYWDPDEVDWAFDDSRALVEVARSEGLAKHQSAKDHAHAPDFVWEEGVRKGPQTFGSDIPPRDPETGEFEDADERVADPRDLVEEEKSLDKFGGLTIPHEPLRHTDGLNEQRRDVTKHKTANPHPHGRRGAERSGSFGGGGAEEHEVVEFPWQQPLSRGCPLCGAAQVLEKALDDRDWRSAAPAWLRLMARHTLAALQRSDVVFTGGRWFTGAATEGILRKGYSVELGDLVSTVGSAALRLGQTDVWADAYRVRGRLDSFRLLRKAEVQDRLEDVAARLLEVGAAETAAGLVGVLVRAELEEVGEVDPAKRASPPLGTTHTETLDGDREGHVVIDADDELTVSDGETVYDLEGGRPVVVNVNIQKGYSVGWYGNAQRTLAQAAGTLRRSVGDLPEDTRVALQAILDDIDQLEAQLGVTQQMEKDLLGDEATATELEVVQEVAKDTLPDVEAADQALEAVGYREPDLADGGQVVAKSRLIKHGSHDQKKHGRSGGQSPKGSENYRQSRQAIEQYLGAMKQIHGKKPEGWRYGSLGDALSEAGTWYGGQEFDDEEKEQLLELFKGLGACKTRECYSNAFRLAMRADMLGIDGSYVEGLGYSGLIPTEHGWFELNGKPVDLTWQGPTPEGEDVFEHARRRGRIVSPRKLLERAERNARENAYVGFKVPLDRLAEVAVDTGVYGGVLEYGARQLITEGKPPSEWRLQHRQVEDKVSKRPGLSEELEVAKLDMAELVHLLHIAEGVPYLAHKLGPLVSALGLAEEDKHLAGVAKHDTPRSKHKDHDPRYRGRRELETRERQKRGEPTADVGRIDQEMRAALAELALPEPELEDPGDTWSSEAGQVLRRNLDAHLEGHAAYLPEEAVERVAGALHHQLNLFERTGLVEDPRQVDSYMKHAVNAIAYQDLHSWQRQLGDHGVWHITGNIELTDELLGQLQETVGHVKDEDRLLASVAQVYHDIGYTVGAAAETFAGTKEHPAHGHDYIEQNNMFKELFGEEGQSRIAAWVKDHQGSTVDWAGDPAGTALRLADNLALFSREKLPAYLRYVPGADAELQKLAEAGSRGEFLRGKARLRRLVDAAEVNPKLKKHLQRAVDEVMEQSPKFTLGMFAGELMKPRFDGETMHVPVRFNERSRTLQKLFNLGQAQFKKVAEDYGAGEEELQRGEFSVPGLHVKVVGAPRGVFQKRSPDSRGQTERDELDDPAQQVASDNVAVRTGQPGYTTPPTVSKRWRSRHTP